MQEFNQALIQQVLPVLGTLVGTILSILLTALASYVHEKYKNEKIDAAISLANETAYNVVMGIEQVVVSEIIKFSSDGKLSDEEKAKIKNKAIESLKNQLKPQTKKALNMAYDNLDEYFDKLLETKVKEVKVEYPRNY